MYQRIKPFLKCFLWSLKTCFETRILLKFPHVCDNVTLLLLRRFYCIQRGDVSLLGAGRLLRIVMCGPGPRGETRGPEWGEWAAGAATQINVHKLSHHLQSSTHLYRMGTIMLWCSFDPCPKVYFFTLYALLALALCQSQEDSVESSRAKLFSEFEEVSWKRSNTKHQIVFDLYCFALSSFCQKIVLKVLLNVKEIAG